MKTKLPPLIDAKKMKDGDIIFVSNNGYLAFGEKCSIGAFAGHSSLGHVILVNLDDLGRAHLGEMSDTPMRTAFFMAKNLPGWPKPFVFRKLGSMKLKPEYSLSKPSELREKSKNGRLSDILERSKRLAAYARTF